MKYLLLPKLLSESHTHQVSLCDTSHKLKHEVPETAC